MQLGKLCGELLMKIWCMICLLSKLKNKKIWFAAKMLVENGHC